MDDASSIFPGRRSRKRQSTGCQTIIQHNYDIFKTNMILLFGMLLYNVNNIKKENESL